MDCVILAAGKGTRMKSSRPKVLHKLGGMAMIEHLLDVIDPLELTNIILIVGYKEDWVREELSDRDVKFVTQKEQLGTGHALKQGLEKVRSDELFVLPGDIPLLKTSSLEEFIELLGTSSDGFSLLTVGRDDPSGYGRIVRGGEDTVERIVEEQDASQREKSIKEINTGIYLFNNNQLLREGLESLEKDNAQGEYYLTDLVEIYCRRDVEVSPIKVDDPEQFLGVNTRVDLAVAAQVLNERKLTRLMNSGVTVLDPKTTLIDSRVEIDRDSKIRQFTTITGDTSIGRQSVIGPDVEIRDSFIGSRVRISHSVVEKSTVRSGAVVEPYQYVRPNSTVEENSVYNVEMH